MLRFGWAGGQVAVVGSYTNGGVSVGPHHFHDARIATGYTSGFVARFSSLLGTTQIARNFASTGNNSAMRLSDVDLSPDGRLMVGGVVSSGTVDFGNGPVMAPADDSQSFVVRFLP